MVNQRQKEIVQEFSGLTWENRYKHLIQIGRDLPEMEESLKLDKFKVKGCQSQVWLHAHLNKQGRVIYVADSDALIVKGLICILLKVFSGAYPTEVMQSSVSFIKELGFDSHLSPSRANGFMAMIKQIKLYAMAFQMMDKSQQGKK